MRDWKKPGETPLEPASIVNTMAFSNKISFQNQEPLTPMLLKEFFVARVDEELGEGA